MNVADRPLIESAKPQGGIITVFDRDHHMTASTSKYVIGNWKLNPASLNEAKALAAAVKAALADQTEVKLGCAPGFLHLSEVAAVLADSTIWVGAQDISANTGATGAFTGDVSAAQIIDAGARFVILGHSERRQYQGEDNPVLAKKIQQASAADLVVILCVGETESQYKSGETLSVLEEQLSVLDGLGVPRSQLIIAYEPVWAIGTGLTPTIDEVVAVHRHIRATLADKELPEICVLYGGSVNADNAAAFASAPEVAGALVGGASLKADAFAQIVTAFAS